MTFQQRAYQGLDDQAKMADLVHRLPDQHLHVADLPYRFSSWAFDEPENCRLWLDEAGTVRAWVVMQTPFWSIDLAWDAAHAPDLLPQMLTWADQRAQTLKDSSYGRPCWFVNPFVHQTDAMQALELAGFADQSDVGENSWSKVLMQQFVREQRPAPEMPKGFRLRPLAAGDVAAYVEVHRVAFGGDSMTVDWRKRTRAQPAYLQALDLVAVDETDKVVAFCIGWLCRDTTPVRGQIEPLGVHPEFHGQGLGRAILLEGLRRLEEAGAQEIFIETDNYRDAAFALYESVGFRVQHDVLVLRKDYA